MKRFGHAAFDRNHFRAIVAFAMPVAQTVTQPLPLAGTVIDELRRRRVLLPPPAVIEAIVRRALQQAEQLTHEILTNGIEADKLAALDALLTRRSDQGATWLAWLRNAPQSRQRATSCDCWIKALDEASFVLPPYPHALYRHGGFALLNPPMV